MKQHRRRLGWMLSSLVIWGSVSGLNCSANPPMTAQPETTLGADEPTPAPSPLEMAFEAATSAATLAQSAATSNDWSQVAIAWSEAIQALQAVPPESPEWLFAQRKTQEYLENQAIALQKVETVSDLVIFPSLGNDVLDEQVGVYLSYVATFGPPDILVVGSSRALQGVNPQILQQRLTQQGIQSPKVYTFAVNGATAQVMSFVLRQLLTPEQLPRMIVWADNSRAFNSGRVDRTFAKILESPGYAAVRAGDRPEVGWVDGEEVVSEAAANAATEGGGKANPMPLTGINGYGFLAVSDVFDPATYYQQFPRVAGVYDDAYRGFNLDGVQTVSFRAIAAFSRANEIPLVFVNLPLSDDYLDETRLYYERQFQQYLAAEASQGGFTVVDLLQEWPNQDHFFADPSHLNRIGATQVAIRVAQDPTIPWTMLNPEASPPENPPADAPTAESEATEPEGPATVE